MAKADRSGFDFLGTLLLSLTLTSYALAMTLGRGHFGALNLTLILGAVMGAFLFVGIEKKAATPLIQMVTFRNPVLSAGLAMSSIVTTVVMATLVVGPFYLSGTLSLEATSVGLVMSVGPIVAALTGVPAGRLVDRFGAHWISVIGLVAMGVGSLGVAMVPTAFGIPGYVTPLVVLTGGYALFQAANNTSVMTDIKPDQRGVIAGLLNLSRNLGLITGASVMGAIFALASRANDIKLASSTDIATGMRFTFFSAAILILVALGISVWSRFFSGRLPDVKGMVS